MLRSISSKESYNLYLVQHINKGSDIMSVKLCPSPKDNNQLSNLKTMQPLHATGEGGGGGRGD